jgi:DGQHR domain-containing protein
MIMGQVGIRGFLVSQNGQDFIIGKAKIEEVLQYTKYTERLIIGYDENENPIYNDHVQRKVDKARVEKIADFLINDETATFPTNVVLGIPQNMIESQTLNDDGIINLVFNDKVVQEVVKAKEGDVDADIYVTIIDGQHRIRGIEVAIDRLRAMIDKSGDDKIQYWQDKLTNLLNIELVISCFIDKTLEYQAMIFSTINRTQKRVSQDLVYSLFGLSTADSPYKTALEIVLALNGHPKSPFYKRIKLYGGNYDKTDSPPLSQATMVKSIVALISTSLRESENDKYRERKDLRVCNSKKKLPFRIYYANDEDKKIADCMFYFFSAVKRTFPQWNYNGLSKPTNILQSTVGYEAMMKILIDILNNYSISLFSNNCFDEYLSKISNIDVDNIALYPMSTIGKKALYNAMFIGLFPNDSTVEKKKEELRNIYKM